MNRIQYVLLMCLGLSVLAGVAQAEDLTGKWGVSGIAQAAFPVGQKAVKDQARDVGPDLGGLVRYGISSHWSAGVSYENLDLGHGIRVEPIDATAIYSFMPGSRWTPTALVGLGAGRGVDTRIFNDLTSKAALGIDYFVMPNVAVGPQVAYHYISDTGTESRRHAHVLTAGLMASLFFGGESAAPAKAEAPKAAAVPPPPAPVALTLNPAESTLGPGQTQQLNAAVTGTSNQGVAWAYNPQLGTLSNAGLYSAPAAIALPETVTVTATSLADGSKTATAIVKLTPPAAAPQQVSIQLNVLFDTAKDVVKPQFDAEIKQVADFLKTYPSSRAEIEGHTDNVGADAYNLNLSQRRADSVRRYLTEKLGVEGSRLSAKGYGEHKPIADNKTPEGRAKNRRVVATFTAVKS